MKVQEDSIHSTTLGRIQTTVTSRELTEKRKVKMTKTVIGDFANLPDDSDQLNDLNRCSRGELAYLIVLKCEEVLRDVF